MTDANPTDDAPPPAKKRGSVEHSPEELAQLNISSLQPNLSMPDEFPAESKEEVEVQNSPKPEDLRAPDEVPKKKRISFNDGPPTTATSMNGLQDQPPDAKRQTSAHRRRRTEGDLNYTPGTQFFKSASSSAVIQMMQRDLPPSASGAMQKKANDLKLERELKHAEIKLREAQDQCKTAVEIIGNLQRENEDLLQKTEMLTAQFGATQTELKISEQKVQSLEDQYRNDTTKMKEELDRVKNDLAELQQDMTTKDMQLNEAQEYRKTIQQNLANESTEDGGGKSKKSGSRKEKQLQKELDSLKKSMNEKDNKIEKLMSELENTQRAQHEKEKLQREMNSLNEMAQQDLTTQRLQIEKMTQEIMLLASRNSSLEKEREDLMQLLEDRDYENQMLKTGYGLHRTRTANITKMSSEEMGLGGLAAQLGMEDDDYNQTLDLALQNAESNSQAPYEYDDSEEYDNNTRDSTTASPKHKPEPVKEEKKEERVADVTREYLHLTASVVNMKFPRIQHISSEELINKVKNYQFWEYHDMMVRIMKTEEQKMVAKEKAEKEAKMANAQANTTQAPAPGMLSRFRNFFGGGGTTTTRARGSSQRKSMATPSTTSKKAPQTRARPASQYQANGSDQIRKRSTTDKPAPPAPLYNNGNKKMDVRLAQAKQGMQKIKMKTKEVGKDLEKKGKQLKKKAGAKAEEVQSKITGIPTEKEKDAMADMSFVGVADLDTPPIDSDNDEENLMKTMAGDKEKKPDIKL